MWARLRAWMMLGLAWVLMTSSRVLRLGRRHGLEAFERNYSADGIRPSSEADRNLLLEAGRCIACGRCELGDAELRRAHPAGYPGLMTLVLSATRNAPDFGEAARSWSLLSDEALRSRQRRCPVGVPLAELGAVVQRLGAERGR